MGQPFGLPHRGVDEQRVLLIMIAHRVLDSGTGPGGVTSLDTFV